MWNQDAAGYSNCESFSDNSTALSLTAGAHQIRSRNRVSQRGRIFVPPSCICELADSGLEFGLGDSAASHVAKRLHLSLTAGNAKRELRPVNRPAAPDWKVVKPVQDRLNGGGLNYPWPQRTEWQGYKAVRLAPKDRGHMRGKALAFTKG